MTKVPIADIKTVRTLADESGIGDLAQEIKKAGKAEPILLRENLNIIDGLRRVEAVKRLGWSEIDAIVSDDIIYVLEVLQKAHADVDISIRRLYEFHVQLLGLNTIRLQRLKNSGQWFVKKRSTSEPRFHLSDEVWKTFHLPYRTLYGRSVRLYRASISGNRVAEELVRRVNLGELTFEAASHKFEDKTYARGEVVKPKEQRRLLEVGLRNIATMVAGLDNIGSPIQLPPEELQAFSDKTYFLSKELLRIRRVLTKEMEKSQ